MSFCPLYLDNNSIDRDSATSSNYLDIRTTHIDLKWSINWDKHLFTGSAILSLEATKEVSEIILDTSYLSISSVEIAGKEVKWTLDERLPGIMGSALHVYSSVKKGDKVDVEIKYETTKDCSALGWLTPVYIAFMIYIQRNKLIRDRQTTSGKYPYLYSQSQAIHGRSFIPRQDTPAIKATYSAKVRSILPVLMSGLRISPPSEETWQPGKEVEYVYDQVS